MSAELDVDRIVRSWLLDGVTALPDRVLDAVLDQVPATPQRRRWPAWRFDMSRLSQLSVAAAAVLVVAVLGATLLPRLAGNGAQTPAPTSTAGGNAPSPTTIPSAAPSPSAPPSAVPTAGPRLLSRTAPKFLDPGTYEVEIVGPRSFVIDVPAEWTGLENGLGNALLVKTAASGGVRGQFGAGGKCCVALLGFYAVEGVYHDPCRDTSPAARPATFAALIDEMTHQVGFKATSVTDATIGGLPAKQIDLEGTFDPGKCLAAPDSQWAFALGAGQGTSGNGTSSPGPQRVWALEIDGTYLVVNAQRSADSPAADVAELNAIVASLRFG